MKWITYLFLVILSIIALVGIILLLSEPIESLPNWTFILIWTKGLGLALIVFVYFAFKWILKYHKI